VGIDISSVISKPYQEHLTLIQGAETARLLLHYDGKQRFTRHALLLANPIIQHTVEVALAEPIDFLFETTGFPHQAPIKGIYEPDESKPFLVALYKQLSQKATTCQISILAVEPQQFQERYHLARQQEQAIIDFLYDGNGFFGQVKPLSSRCNSPRLLNDLREIINQLTN
jgi:hypothetical protein